MVRYELKRNNESTLSYYYYPEGGSLCGVVSIHKETKKTSIDSMAENDPKGRYARKVITKMFLFLEDGMFEKSGHIIWY